MTQTERSIKELELAGLLSKDSDYNGGIGRSVTELLKVFQKQHHSGSSAALTASVFHRLVKGECLTPLKGTPDEWNETGHDCWQNNRVSSVFAANNEGAKAYWIDGTHFIDGGCTVTGYGSAVPVTFPWVQPKTVRRPYWMMFLYRWRAKFWHMTGKF